MNNFIIDLCLTTKNSLDTLPRILNSIRKQNYFENTRLLVADNNSSDGTLNVLKRNDLAKIISYEDDSPEDGFNKLLKNDQNKRSQ